MRQLHLSLAAPLRVATAVPARLFASKASEAAQQAAKPAKQQQPSAAGAATPSAAASSSPSAAAAAAAAGRPHPSSNKPDGVADALPSIVDEIHGYSLIKALGARCVTRRTVLFPGLVAAAAVAMYTTPAAAAVASTVPLATCTALAAVTACAQRLLVRGRQTLTSATPIRMDGRICVVTGGTAGLGLAVVVRLLDLGAEVVVLSKSLASEPDRADITRAYIVAHAKAKAQALERLEFKACDLADPHAVASVVAALRTDKYFIDVLVNNAGFFSDVPRRATKKCPGLEQHIGANFVGPYALTEGLLPLLRASPRGARVVYVTCGVHGNVRSGTMIATRLAAKPAPASPSDGSSDAQPHINQGSACLGAAKLGCLYHVRHLSERRSEVVAGKLVLHPPVLACSVDPGALTTAHFVEAGSEPFLGNGVVAHCLRSLLKKTPDEGATAVVDCATRPDLVNGGHYVEGLHLPSALSRQTFNERQRADVMRWVAQRAKALGFLPSAK